MHLLQWSKRLCASFPFQFLKIFRLNFVMPVIFGSISNPFANICRRTAQQMFKLLLLILTKPLPEVMPPPSKLSKNHSIWELWPILMMWLERVRWAFIGDEKPRSSNTVRNNLWDWQALQITSGPGTRFSKFCDALEVKDGVQAPFTGWGLDHALNAWGSYWRNTYFSQSKAFHNIKECRHIDNSNSTVCGTSSEEFVNYDPLSDTCPDLCLGTV